MHDLSCEGADPSARAGRHQRRDVDLHHHPMIVMMMIDIIITITNREGNNGDDIR